MKRKTILIITTRDYPCSPNEGFTYLDIPKIEEVMKKYVRPKDQGNLNRLLIRIEDESEIDEFPDAARRILVWEQRDASWCKDTDYFENTVLAEGLKLAKKSLGENEGNKYIIYVGPCTNGQGELQFRREYSAAMLLTALEDCGSVEDVDRIILVAHDKDIVDEDGCGPVPLAVFEKCEASSMIPTSPQFQILKFQHEQGTDIVWETIIRPIRDNTLSIASCDDFMKLVSSFREQNVEFSSLFRSDVTTKSYLEKVDKVLLAKHYPELFPELQNKND